MTDTSKQWIKDAARATIEHVNQRSKKFQLGLAWERAVELLIQEAYDAAHALRSQSQTGHCPLCGSPEPTEYRGQCLDYDRRDQPAHVFHWNSTSDESRAQMIYEAPSSEPVTQVDTSKERAAKDAAREISRQINIDSDISETASQYEIDWISAIISECMARAEQSTETLPSKMLTAQLYRSLERLHLAVIGCGEIGFEESSPVDNAHHASVWNDLNEAQKDAALKLKHFKEVAEAPRPVEPQK